MVYVWAVICVLHYNTFELEDAKRVYKRTVFGSMIDNSWPVIGNSSNIYRPFGTWACN